MQPPEEQELHHMLMNERQGSDVKERAFYCPPEAQRIWHHIDKYTATLAFTSRSGTYCNSAAHL
ncbi:Uncharacterized protein DAT39_005162 [Clarias magur]|uniref:Uncharacterized protein n=1 Tax=Clarias magur TaxID=1594786 RepID=A0A8J4U3M0_CLAMG|nr:Uncharacterized protein DAT39_005162 [Clarias magur]